jgi:molybdenum cofactor cytidylyltransferase
MAVAIVPAAGRSRRMGRPKLLLPFGEQTVLGATLEALARGGVGTIVLVGAPGDDDLGRWAASHGARLAINPRPDDGMLTSVWAGLEALGGAAALLARGEELLVCPGDLPRLRADTVAALLREAREAGAWLLVPRCGKERGHPLVVRGELLLEIPALDPAVGLRQLRQRHPERTLEVEVADPGVVLDVDTPDDYERLRSQ